MSFKVANTTAVNPISGSHNLATGKIEFYNYGYNPNFGASAFYAVLLVGSLLVHVFQAFRYKVHWMLWTVGLGATGEALGWIARAWSARTVKWEPSEGGYWNSADAPAIIQVVALIFCPAFVQAANYLILGLLITKFGIQYSRLTPRRYLGIFLTVDIISLFVQAAGGSAASGSDPSPSEIHTAVAIMQGGIFWQLGAMVIFTALFLEFAHRFKRHLPLPHPKLSRTLHLTGSLPTPHDELERARARTMIRAVMVANALIFVRSVYRGIEISLGFDGWAWNNQAMFAIFDGLLMICALITLNVYHPGRLLGYVRIPKKRELLLSNIDPINKATSQFGSSSSADGLMEMQQARVV